MTCGEVLRKCIECLGMALPIINHAFVANVEPHTIIGGNVKLVVIFRRRHEIARPTCRKVVNRSIFYVTRVAPAKVYLFIRASQGRLSLQGVIVEVFALQSAAPSNGS